MDRGPRIIAIPLCNGQIDETQTMVFGGLKPPYAPPPTSFKIGRTVPLQWQYTDAQGTVVDSAAAGPIVSLYGLVPCGDTTGGATLDVSAPDNSGYHYDAATKNVGLQREPDGDGAGLLLLQITSATAQASLLLPISIQMR